MKRILLSKAVSIHKQQSYWIVTVTWIWVFNSQLLQSSQLPPPVFFSSFPWVFLRFFCRKKSRGLDFFRTAYTAEPNGQRCMDTWACPACTFENAGSAECCEICQKGRRPERKILLGTLPKNPLSKPGTFESLIWVFLNIFFPPKISHSSRIFHYKPSILRYPYFWKHPYSFSRSVGYVIVPWRVRLKGRTKFHDHRRFPEFLP